MSAPQLHVQVDALICQGTGYCERLASDVFAVGEDNTAKVLQPHPGPERQNLMEEAATLCPTRAITY